jgi:hypothetical protein
MQCYPQIVERIQRASPAIILFHAGKIAELIITMTGDIRVLLLA